MIDARVQRSREGRVIGFTVTGHAGYAERGKDVVCAAVSALAQAAVLGLERLGLEPEVEMSEGCLKCVSRPGDQALDRSSEAQAVLETLVAGLTDIARDNPDYVRLRQEQATGRGDGRGSAALR